MPIGAQPAPAATLGPADAGTTVEVAVGAAILIRLPENPTTGYRWEMSPVPGLAVAVTDASGPSGPGTGAGRERGFLVSPHAPGRGEIRLTLRRAWDPPDGALDRFAVTLVAR